jgi:membrane associated rhomboid family serine protease
MWIVFYLEFIFPLANFGIVPRTPIGLIGIITAPVLHASFSHLISNSVPLLFLGSVLFFFYPKIGGIVFTRCYFLTNVLVWMFAWRESNHIGASGLVYGLAFFLIFFGIFRRDFISILISVVILLMYGGIFYGVLPSDPRISWESHLSGALVGIFTAVTFSSKKQVS